MKKAITVLLIMLSLGLSAQDSIKVSVNVQARDLEYIGSFIFNDNSTEDLYDSLKVKFRVANPPTGTTTVSITGYTSDFVTVIMRLSNDATALKALCYKRVADILRAVNQPYLTAKLDDFDAADQSTFQTMRIFGRTRLRRLAN